MKRGGVIVAVLLLALVGGMAWRMRSQHKAVEQAYAVERRATVWSSTAQVREPVASLAFGERVEVLQHLGEDTQVETSQGIEGWMDARQLMPADLWHQVSGLSAKAGSLPVQARGHTKVFSNLHLEPGRDAPRILQLTHDVPLELLARRSVPVAAGANHGKADADTGAKLEDWWLVRANTKETGELAGWVLGRFIALDLPEPIPEYAGAAGMRVAGWYELNRVPDKSGALKPQYLIVGTRGSEGQPCDFTMLRVFTWGNTRQRYETAYVESNVCGSLPVFITPASANAGPQFRFTALDTGVYQPRLYEMRQTVVRRVRPLQSASARPRRGSPPGAP